MGSPQHARPILRWGWMVALASAGCEDAADANATSAGGDDTSGSGGAGGAAVVNPDGDCLSDEQEAELGTDPNAVDSDLDGITDCDEVACVSSPTDPAELCYTCGWKHADPGTLVSTGNDVGDVIENIELADQCGDVVKLWDFAGEYHILFMTAAW